MGEGLSQIKTAISSQHPVPPGIQKNQCSLKEGGTRGETSPRFIFRLVSSDIPLIAITRLGQDPSGQVIKRVRMWLSRVLGADWVGTDGPDPTQRVGFKSVLPAEAGLARGETRSQTGGSPVRASAPPM